MFGTYRFALAVSVVLSHFCGVPILGWLAVSGFFVLSGYLMTLVMQRAYGYHGRGVARFAANRVLRLYPAWWVTMGVAALVIAGVGADAARTFDPLMRLPDAAGSWAAHIALVFLGSAGAVDTSSQAATAFAPHLSPPAWSLTVELAFYAVIALGASRTPRATLVWLALALLYTVGTFALGAGAHWRYGALGAGALPFAVGAGLFHLLREPPDRAARALRSVDARIWSVVALTLCALLTVGIMGGRSPDGGGADFWGLFYLNIALNALVIAVLALRGRARAGGWDERLGDVSYPLYLLHMPVGLGLSVWVLGRAERVADLASLGLAAMTVAACCALAELIARAVDAPVAPWRDRLRSPGLAGRG